MDETMTNGTEVEEVEALIPEGWDGEGDFFDDASWSDETETSVETEPVVEEGSTPEVDPTMVTEETVEEEQEEAPTTEPEEPEVSNPRKLKFKAKVDHNDLDVELDEADRQELPGMGDIAPNGKPQTYGARTKGKQHRTPDSVADDHRFHQMHIIFEDIDREVADYEAQDWEGEIRQREEPPANMHDHD